MSTPQQCKIYRQKNAEKIKERRKIYYQNNKELKKLANKEYYENNKEERKEYTRLYYIKNTDRILKSKKIYKKNNVYKQFVYDARRKNKKFEKRNPNSNQLDYDENYLKDLFKKQNGRCYWSDLIMLDVFEDNKNPFQMSVDRIDNSKGYFKDNIVLCCLMMNYARNTCDFETWSDIMKNKICIKYR